MEELARIPDMGEPGCGRRRPGCTQQPAVKAGGRGAGHGPNSDLRTATLGWAGMARATTLRTFIRLPNKARLYGQAIIIGNRIPLDHVQRGDGSAARSQRADAGTN